jgi:phage terminase large subunit-like protein
MQKAPLYTYAQYILDVISGKIVVCKAVRKMVQRHLRDIERSKDASYFYYFDEKEANRPIKFFAQFIRGNEGKFFNKPIVLLPWQQFITAMIFGWRRKDDGLRRFQKALIFCGKKQGKSVWVGGLGLYGQLEENGAESYVVSGKREQASIVFKYVKSIISKDVDLQSIFTVYAHHIESNHNGRTGIFSALSSEASTADGKNPSFLIIDEWHNQQNSDLTGALESGMIMREQPLTIAITTAGGIKTGPCFEAYNYLQKVLDGIIEDDTYFAALYELDPEDDWQEPTKWIKACPSLGAIATMAKMMDNLKRAKQLASEEWDFKTKNLNIWLDIQNAWIDADIWDKNTEQFDIKALVGKDCWAAIDLSKTRDLTGMTLCFRPDESFKKYRFLHLVFIPEEAITQKQETENILYRRWISEKLVIATPGNHVDYAYILAKIKEAAESYHIREIAFDPYNAGWLDAQLVAEGFVTVEMRQGIAHFSPWAKSWERAVLKGEIADPSPIAKYCVSNAIVKPDANSNIKPFKAFASGKIDLVITSIMAFARANAVVEPVESEEYTAADLDAWGIAPLPVKKETVNA